MSNQSFNQNPNYGQRNSSLAVVSLIAGIASYFIVPVLGAIAAVITGGMAKKEIRESAGQLTGMAMANWGVILGWINIGLGLIGLCIGLLGIIGVFSLPVCFLPFADMNY